MTCKQIVNQLQGGSHREVECHMPSAALYMFKVQANLSSYASAFQGVTKTKICGGDFPPRLKPGILSVQPTSN